MVLFNNSFQQCYGALHGECRNNMTYDEAKGIISEYTNFDYLKGRVLKVNLTGDEFDEWLYDRDCGIGAALKAINSIR